MKGRRMEMALFKDGGYHLDGLVHDRRVQAEQVKHDVLKVKERASARGFTSDEAGDEVKQKY